MTNALRIDTLAFAKRLEEAGADTRLAEAIVEGLAVADISHLATRDDLREEIAGLRAGLAQFATRNDLAEIKAELVQFATREHLNTRIDKTEAVLRTEIAEARGELKDAIGKSSNRILFAFMAFAGALVVAMFGGFIAPLNAFPPETHLKKQAHDLSGLPGDVRTDRAPAGSPSPRSPVPASI